MGNGGLSFVNDIITSLVQAISGSGVTGPVLKSNTTAIQTQLSGSVPFSSITNPDYNNGAGAIPKAYLSVIFFDERFNVISEGSISKRVEQPGAGAPVLPLSNIKAPKNGYCFVYVSNESDEMLYFDNLQVTQNHARIIEENHYYAYGLKIAAISSKKMPDLAEGHIKNNNQYQGDYSEFDEELGWNDFDLRNYDPQIGRWIQQDPFQEFPSPYTGMGNDPVNNIDPTGGGIFDGLGAIAKIGVKTFLGAVVGTAIDINSGGDGTKGFAIGAGVGLLGGIAGNFGIRVIAGGVTKAVGMASGSSNPYARWVGGGVTINERIARLAREKVDAGSKNWDYNNSPRGNKCNFFVHDILKEAGATAPTTWFRNPFRWTAIKASQWADPNYYIPNWRVLSKTEMPQPGDVIAEQINYGDASGHVGIVVKFGQTASQESKPERLGISNYGFRADGDKTHDGHGHYRNSTFRRYTSPSPFQSDGIPRYEHGRIM